MERVSATIDSLCSPKMYGRGATHDGQKIAAHYLANQFKQLGLKPITENYFQYFNYNISTFPGSLSLKIDTTLLIVGADFIAHPSSPSAKGSFPVTIIDSAFLSSKKKLRRFLKKDFLTTVVVIEKKLLTSKSISDELLKKIKAAPCLVELEQKKLTMGLSSTQSKQPLFTILTDRIPKNIKTISFEIESNLLTNYQAQNICGVIEGSLKPDSFLFITAHYDHLGTLGKTAYFPGANDNGSGVSMLIELANYFKKNPPLYSIAFIAFGAEEAGLIGSKYFTENPLVPLSSIRFLINLDLMGTGDEGMMVVNGTIFPKEFSFLTSINHEKNYLPELKKRGKAANSDHYFFTEKGVPAFFFYTLGGISAYHDIYDVPQTLPLTKYKETFSLIVDFISLLSLN